MGMVAIICWHIWKYRNLKIFQNKESDPHMVVHKCIRDWNETQVSIAPSRNWTNTEIDTISEPWQPPPIGFLKINYDASFQMKVRKAQMAFICRNYRGQIIYAAVSTHFCSSSAVAEALAIREAVRFA